MNVVFVASPFAFLFHPLLIVAILGCLAFVAFRIGAFLARPTMLVVMAACLAWAAWVAMDDHRNAEIAAAQNYCDQLPPTADQLQLNRRFYGVGCYLRP